uniref:Uncharacterized protein n=1 Tax=Spironucleus salmonicida TaxID=348837 RepID=V6LF40_9EUKA|eukprot:EST42296.1 Hypothetical protein SS50377_18165 [Spironucleus salmonicida]
MAQQFVAHVKISRELLLQAPCEVQIVPRKSDFLHVPGVVFTVGGRTRHAD